MSPAKFHFKSSGKPDCPNPGLHKSCHINVQCSVVNKNIVL